MVWIGTSHANEILPLAWEDPAQRASSVLSDKSRRERLKQAIIQFFKFAYSDKYLKTVPSGRNGSTTFADRHYIIRNIIALQQRVYGHTKSPTKLSKEHYQYLFENGLLARKYQALGTSKRRDQSYTQSRRPRADTEIISEVEGRQGFQTNKNTLRMAYSLKPVG